MIRWGSFVSCKNTETSLQFILGKAQTLGVKRAILGKESCLHFELTKKQESITQAGLAALPETSAADWNSHNSAVMTSP